MQRENFRNVLLGGQVARLIAYPDFACFVQVAPAFDKLGVID
jgi:hypothetical protein